MAGNERNPSPGPTAHVHRMVVLIVCMAVLALCVQTLLRPSDFGELGTRVIAERAEKHRRSITISKSLQSNDSAHSTVQQRRRYPRYLLTKPVLAVPLLPGRLLDWNHRAEGLSVDFSKGGVGIEVLVKLLPVRLT